MCIPTRISEYAFSGSLCRIREFETLDGLRYCINIFSLSDYKHLHFPHYEYKYLVSKLYACQSTQAIFQSAYKSYEQKLNVSVLKILHSPFNSDFKIKFGENSLTVGPVTAFGIVKTAPFRDVDIFSVNMNQFTCDSKWDICACKTCPVFRRLIEYEATAVMRWLRRAENMIL